MNDAIAVFLAFSKQNKGIFPAVRGSEITCDYAGSILTDDGRLLKKLVIPMKKSSETKKESRESRLLLEGFIACYI